MKILIWGAGHFGQALGHVLREAGHDVTMYIRNLEKAEKAVRRLCANVTVVEPQAEDFEHVFVTTDTAGLLPALEDIGIDKRPNTSLWLVQKGVIPRKILWSKSWKGVYYLTGAALSKDLKAGKVVGMILAARPEHWDANGPERELIGSLKQVRGVYWHEPMHIVGMNRLRTIGSLQRGLTDQLLADSPSTRALAVSSIEAEGKLIARKVDLKPLLNGSTAESSRVLRVLKADEELCSQKGSRNYEAGRCLALDDAKALIYRLIEKNGVVEGIANVHSLYTELGATAENLPYLSLTKRILDGELSAKQAQAELEGRTDGWL